jgi:replicative DNA helicase
MNLPHSEEHERAIVVNVLLDGAPALSRAFDAKITADSFYCPTYRKIWKGILDLHGRGKPLETSVLAEEMKAGGKLEEIGGFSGLHEATSGNPSVATYDYSLEKVRDLYMMRRVIAISDETKAIAYSSTAPLGTVDDFVTKIGEVLSLKSANEHVKNFRDAVAEVAASCMRMLRGEKTPEDEGMRFPWSDWNNTMGAAKGGELIIIAARPSAGKSSAARQIAWNWANEYGTVLYFSHEMTCVEMAKTMIQLVSRVSYRAIEHGYATAKQATEVESATKVVMAQDQLFVFDQDPTYSAVMSRIQALKQTNKIRAIIVDYLQIQDPQQERSETRDIAIGRMSKGYKRLANTLNVPVILLSQISRMVERDSRVPRLSDLRESGNIEQDADRVIFLHVPPENPQGVRQDLTDGNYQHVYVEAIQAKGRSTGQHTVPMTFHRPTTTFHNYAS